jgi:hypothetical protein
MDVENMLAKAAENLPGVVAGELADVGGEPAGDVSDHGGDGR